MDCPLWGDGSHTCLAGLTFLGHELRARERVLQSRHQTNRRRKQTPEGSWCDVNRDPEIQKHCSILAHQIPLVTWCCDLQVE